MKLESLTVNEFKRFGTSFTLNHLHDGLNLFVGPNEAGKSTLVSAIRTAFFERHRSRLNDLRPWNDSNAAPTISLGFTHDGHQYALTKRFLSKARCELYIDDMQYEGDDAEDQLKQLLGFEQTTKGSSKPSHQGIPGLLWIQQGDAHEIATPVQHASERLRGILESMIGQVSTSSGDQLIGQVQTLRDAILTPSTSKPKGEYEKALKQHEELEQQRLTLDQEIARYQSRVDELDQLRQEQRTEEKEDRAGQLVAQLETARKRLADYQAKRQQLELHQSKVRQLTQDRQRILDQLKMFDQEQQRLVERKQALSKSKSTVDEHQVVIKTLEHQLSSSRKAYDDHQNQLNIARQRSEVTELKQRYHYALQDKTQLSQQISNARDAQKNLRSLERQRHAIAINSKEIDDLRRNQHALTEVAIKLKSTAPLLEYELEAGKSITVSGRSVTSGSLTGSGQQLLLSRQTLVLPELGKVTITPSSGDLETLSIQQRTLEDQRDAAFSRLGVSSLEEAEKRLNEQTRLQHECDNANTRLEALAPKGIETLSAHLEQVERNVAQLESSLSQLAPSDTPHGTNSEASSDSEEARHMLEELKSQSQHLLKRLEQTEQDLLAARLKHTRFEAVHENQQKEFIETEQRLASDEWQQQLSDLQSSSYALGVDLAEEEKHALTMKEALEATQPDLLTQNVERFEKSLALFHQGQAARKDKLIRLEGELETLGAQGLEEQRARLIPEQEHVNQRCVQFKQRANALTLLLNELQERRQQLVQQLQAPLLAKIHHYLGILFPNAELKLDENLIPEEIKRANDGSGTSGNVNELSFGAREQLGVISRLAYADLLDEAGHPTLLILDDALVNADNQRLGQMKQILFDAAKRHQILIFSCHPSFWDDLGVEARSIQDELTP